MTALVRYERWDRARVLERSSEVLAVMAAALGHPAPGEDRLDTLSRHGQRRGFSFHAALFEDGRLDTVVGFGYGYVGNRGEWFADQLVARLPSGVTRGWVGGHFELVTLAVHPDHEGRGLGTRLHDEVLADSPVARAILMTGVGESRAVRLYRDRGWAPLGGFDDHREVYGRGVAPRPADPDPAGQPPAFLVDDMTDVDRFAWARLFRAYLEFYDRPDPDRVVKQVWRWLAAGEYGLHCLVVRPHRGVGPIGFAHVRSVPRPMLGRVAGFMDDLFVDRAWRGTGAVDALLSVLGERARSHGWAGVRWITGPANSHALVAYERLAERSDVVTFELPT